MKTRFDLTLTLRIAKDSAGNDKFTEKAIKLELINHRAEMQVANNSYFIVWLHNKQIMAEVENINW